MILLKAFKVLIWFLLISDAVFGQMDSQISEIDSLNNYAFAIRKKNPKKTLKLSKKILAKAININYNDGISLAQRNISLGFYYEGKLDSAIIYEVTALRNFELNKDEKKIAGSFNRLGLYHRKNRDNTKAIEYYEKALIAFNKIADSVSTAKVLNNIAVIHSINKNYSEALNLYTKSLNLREKLNDLKGRSKIYHNIGNIYFSEEKYIKALNNYQKSLKLKKELKDTVGIIKAYENIGAVNKKKGNYDNAIKNYKKSLSLINKINNNKLKLSVYRNLSSVYQKKGDYYNTFEYFHYHTLLKDSLYTLAKDKQIAKIREEYETEKKDQTISTQQLEIEKSETEKLLLISLVGFISILSLLIVYGYIQKKKANKILKVQKDNISRINSELEAVNKTKDKLFSIIAHDIRSPIISLQYMTELMDHYFQENQTEEFFEVVPQVNNSAKQLNLMMENLFNWSISQSKNIPLNKTEFEINGLIESCLEVQKMSAEIKNITLTKNESEECEISADLNMMRSVINNLISNAIKFTPQDGNINIDLKTGDGFVNIEITDTGIGIEEEKIDKLFDLDESKIRKGTEGEKGSGLGLIMCKEFLERNDGSISVTSEKGNGTKFLIKLPLSVNKSLENI